MTTTADEALVFAQEATYKTFVTPTRALEYVDESLDWNKNIKQGRGLKAGRRVARSGRRAIPSAQYLATYRAATLPDWLDSARFVL